MSEDRGSNRELLTKLLVIAVAMFGFGYALIPVYKHLCEVLGINVLTQKDGSVAHNTQVDKTRSVTIELDSNVQGTLRFRPTQSSVTVHPGELVTVTYEVVNSKKTRGGSPGSAELRAAERNAALQETGMLLLQAADHEGRRSQADAGVFYIDPALPREVKTITLSYTFIEIAGLNKTASN
jgi:cytochrome c oxidase assembly protein subunit 11